MKKQNTYAQIKMDLKKLEGRIGRRQRYCDHAAQHEDLEAARMYEQDVKDLTDILNRVASGHYKAAWSLIDSLDTAVRDEIPARLYNFIAKENGYN